ncbi:MAG: hypothetical protein CMJ55_03025, partial [Planctomycetaceae bacterium]|nr:hypothetical protein [Planctomycetaceae bacterium]
NFAGGREDRNEVASTTYLNKDVDGPLVRGLIIVLGVVAVSSFTILNWFMTPSSYVYCYIGQRIEHFWSNFNCKKCKYEGEEETETVVNPNPQGLLKKDKLYF